MYDLIVNYFANAPVPFAIYIFGAIMWSLVGIEVYKAWQTTRTIKGRVIRFKTFDEQVREYCRWCFRRGKLPYQTGFESPMGEAERIAQVTLRSATPDQRWHTYGIMLDFAFEHGLDEAWHNESQLSNDIHAGREAACRSSVRIERLSALRFK